MSTTIFEKPWGNYLLEKIIETPAPEKISWLPQTIGWQVICFALVLYIASKIYKAYKDYQSNTYRRDALKRLHALKHSALENNTQQLPLLLRKVALQGFKREQITKLNGPLWDLWLDQQCEKTSFVEQCPNLLYQLSFSRIASIDETNLPVLIQQIELWIKFHRRQDD